MAAQQAPLEEMPAYVRTDLTDAVARELLRQAEEPLQNRIRQDLALEAMVDHGMSIAAANRQLQ